MSAKKNVFTFYKMPNGEIVWLLKDKRHGWLYVQSPFVGTCSKCGGYLQTIPVPADVAVQIDAIGRQRCINCGWIPSLEVFDKFGAENDRNRFEIKSQV